MTGRLPSEGEINARAQAGTSTCHPSSQTPTKLEAQHNACLRCCLRAGGETPECLKRRRNSWYVLARRRIRERKKKNPLNASEHKSSLACI